MKKYAALAGALVCALVIAGTISLTRNSPCPPPVTQILSSDTSGALVAVDKWVGVTQAASYTDPRTVGWGVHTLFKVSPGVIDALIAVGDKYDPSYGYFGGTITLWRIKLVRDCQGGGWRVADVHRVSK